MKLIAMLIALWSTFAMATEQLKCTFYIEGNDTSYDEVKNSVYTTALSLDNGETKSEEIKIRRLLIVPEEEDREEQKKLAYKDVIFLFEKDQSDKKIDQIEEDIKGIASNLQSQSITLKASKMGDNINAKIISPNKTFNLNFNGNLSNRPLEIATNDDDIIDSPITILASRPYIDVSYKHYSWWKLKTEQKRLEIGFSCKKLSAEHISQSEIQKDAQREDSLLDGIIGGASSN